MKRALRQSLLIVALVAWFAGAALVRSGEAPVAHRQIPAEPPESPPSLPPVVTPIDRFRELLALEPSEREPQLALRTPPQRDYLRARLTEFDRLSPRDRELRLELLTLRHHLLPLLRTDRTNRTEGLRVVPPAYRELVRDRLVAWDKVTPQQQRAMLESQSIFAGLAFVASPEGLNRDERALGQLAADKRIRIEADLARWQTLSPDERQRITAQFQDFLTLSEKEQQKTLARLNDASRQKVTRVVESLERLTPEQRAKSVEAFGRFSALPSAERERFLRNAARWHAMSAEEKSAWRRLSASGPPTPPGIDPRTSGPMTPPPLPPPSSRTPVPSAPGAEQQPR